MNTFRIPRLIQDFVGVNTRSYERYVEHQSNQFLEFVDVNRTYWNDLNEARHPVEVLESQNEFARSLWKLSWNDLAKRAAMAATVADEANRALEHLRAPGQTAGELQSLT